MSELARGTPGNWEEARLASLLHFASLTPTQRVEWLADALQLYSELRKRSSEEAISDATKLPNP